MAEGSSSTDDIVTDGYKDIARRSNLDSMMVEVDGRKRFQKVYLWTASNTGGIATETYKPSIHGPDKGGECPRLPADNETIPAKRTREFLEVGLVYGNDPQKNMPKGSSGSKSRSTKKKDKKPERRAEDMMRVFTPVTDYIETQNKVYVGCEPEGGRLNHYLIAYDNVFFYAEFYESIPEGTAQVPLGRMMMSNIREAAARNKTAERPTTAVITPDQLSKKLTAHPIVVTQSEHLSSMLHLQWDLFEETMDVDYLQAMMKSLEEAHPDLKYGPDTSTDGITNFMDFNDVLTDEKAEILSQELKANYPHMNPDIMLIIQTHAFLRKRERSSSNNGKKGKTEPLGNRLMISGFGFFMDTIHKKMVGSDVDSDGNYNKATLSYEINEALDATDTYTHHAKCSWTPSNTVPEGGGKVSTQDLFNVLSCVHEILEKIISFSEKSMEDIAKHHGGLLKSTSFQDVMKKVGDTVDKASLQTQFEQICALHAATLAHSDRESSKIIRDLVEYVGKALLIAEKSLPKGSEGNTDEDGDVEMGEDDQ